MRATMAVETAVIALIFASLAGCFMMPGAPATSGPMMSGTPSSPPVPMSNDDALAYARAHRDTSHGVVTAVNKLAVPVCRLVFLSVEHRTPFVNQAGPTNPLRGNRDPSDEPLLAPGQNSLVMFPTVPPPPSGVNNLAVTAFGCERTEKHMGMYVVDEDKVVFEKTVAIKDQGTVVIAN